MTASQRLRWSPVGLTAEQKKDWQPFQLLGMIASWLVPCLFAFGSGVALTDRADAPGEDALLKGPLLFEPGDNGRPIGSESDAVVGSAVRIGSVEGPA